ncbi:SpoIIE family protein phosphatase [Streptomyces sp. LP11]|uniref:SpoIIE family protein phosphatase n=1 Tax=Streptomyces pyxinicus TaxID=2970331 RepID=A0ABT2B578_9ACTN|nr:GAF domain-containing SpoIIE family protein phosphatase [Streptomyces sp. LP11]MCS0603511.1 SpoIIE family protein phosphatase [Streptomyces sp. LP11]
MTEHPFEGPETSPGWCQRLHELWLAAVRARDVTTLATLVYSGLSEVTGAVAVVGARWEGRRTRYLRRWTPDADEQVTWYPTAVDWPGGSTPPAAPVDGDSPRVRLCALDGPDPVAALVAPSLRETGTVAAMECVFPLGADDAAGLWVGLGDVPSEEERRGLGEQLVQIADVLMASNRRIVEDEIHERRQARDAFLAEASLQMDESLEVEETLRRVARLAVPAVAEGCAVHLFRPDGELEPVATAHVAAHAQTWLGDVALHDAWLAAQLRRIARQPRGQVLKDADLSGSPFGPDATGDGKTIRALSVSPLRARGRVLGTLTFLYHRDDTSLADLPTLADLAGRAALAIDTATLYDQRRQHVETLQRQLLPRVLPEAPGVELSAAYQVGDPSLDVGGDFYDAVITGDRISLFIGDVCGRGAEAAAYTALARHTLRTLLTDGMAPGRTLARLNQALLDEGASRFVTALVVTLTPAAGAGWDAEIAGGGHPWPLVRHADGSVEELPARGLLLGVVPGAEYAPHRVRLADGDALVLFTDGLSEARAADGTCFEDRLPEAVGRIGGVAEASAARLVAAASDFRDMGDDDAAVLIAYLKDRP